MSVISRPLGVSSRSWRCYKKIGDCEQSILAAELPVPAEKWKSIFFHRWAILKKLQYTEQEIKDFIMSSRTRLSFIAFSVQFLFCKYLFLECSHQKRFYWSKKFVAKHFVDITIYLSEANDLLPWVPETFLARFPVFSRGFATRGFGQHRKFPPHVRKTSGTQGNDLFNRKLGIVNWGFFLTIPDNFWAGTKTILDRGFCSHTKTVISARFL